ncbi:MAG: ammonium transporter, partial [Halanaerobiales bacterium]
PVGAIAVHGVCGAFGTLAVGFLAVEGGLFYGGGLSLLGVQLTGVVSVFLWTFPLALILFKVIDKIVGLRVSEEDELEGLDASEHGIISYPDFIPTSTSKGGVS